MTDIASIPSNWLFSDGVRQWTPANSHFAVAAIDTDANGNITGWQFNLYSYPGFALPEVSIISSTPPSSYAPSGTYGHVEVDLAFTNPYETAWGFWGPGVDTPWTRGDGNTQVTAYPPVEISIDGPIYCPSTPGETLQEYANSPCADSYRWTFTELPSGAWFDPTVASSFTYTMTSASLFTRIVNFPTGFTNPFTVSAGGVVLGVFSPGQSLVFPNGGVSQFTISGINPSVDPSSMTSFPLQLAFNTATASFTQQNVSNFAVSTSGLAYSRVTQTFNGTVTVKNVGSIAIGGPLQVLFQMMTGGVTLVNATGIASGVPYLPVPGVTSLAPGQSVTVNVQFKNPSNATINFLPAVYLGAA